MSGTVAGLAWPARARPRVVARRLADWADAERGRFAPWLPVLMGAGACGYLSLLAEPDPWAGPVAALVALLVLVASWRVFAARMAAAATLAAALGFTSGQLATLRADPVEPLPSRAAILTATVHAVELVPDGRRLTLANVRLTPDAPELQRQLRVRLKKGDATDVRNGDLVRIRALLRPPPMPAYPGAWDMQREAFFGDLAGSGTALNPVEVMRRDPPVGMAATMQAARDAVSQRTTTALPGAAGAVAAALFTGVQTAIPMSDREAFRNSGLSHLLSVSGLHVGIVMGLLMGATRLLLALHERTALHWPNKAIAALVGLAGGGAYVLFIGAQVPLLRAFAMACLVALAIMLGRRALSLRGLALAAVVVLAVAPAAVQNVSFQMSFAAVLALVAGFEALRPALTHLRVERRQPVLAWVAALALTSVLAGTASAPYGAYHFGHFQPYYVLSNLLAVPLTAFWVMPAGMAALALMPFGWEWLALVPMGWGIEATLWLARTVASWPASSIPVPHITAWGLAAYSLGLVWLCVWRTPVRLAGAGLIAAGLLSSVTAPPDMLVSPDARLIALRADGYWMQSRSGAQKFLVDSWENYLGAGPLRLLRSGVPPECADNACRLQTPAGTVALVRNVSTLGDCTGVVLLVSSEPARGECPPHVPMVDRFTVWRDGAHAVWFTASGPRVLSDRAHRGARPWVPPPPQPRRNTPNLPMAVEDAPATE